MSTETVTVTPTDIVLIRGGDPSQIRIDRSHPGYELWTVGDDFRMEVLTEDEMRLAGWVRA